MGVVNVQNSSQAALTELQHKLARVTRERDEALTQAEQANTERAAAEALLDEAANKDIGELAAQITTQQEKLQELQATTTEEKARKQAAESATSQARATTTEVRAMLQTLIETKRAEERKLRDTVKASRDAMREQGEAQEVLAELRTEAASYGRAEAVSCGCTILVKKGPKCTPGAMITIITPCTSLGDDELEYHVTESQ